MKNEMEMISFSSYLKENANGVLYIFDIDDTLFKTHARVNVIDADGKVVHSLKSKDFGDYKLLPGQHYEYSEFKDSDKFDRTSRPIKKMLNKVKDLQKEIEGTKSRIIFVTARSDFDDKDKFLKVFRKRKIDIDKIHIYRSGNDPADISNADKKAKVIRKQLKSGIYTKADMYDDKMDNLEAFKGLHKEFPDISFGAYQVFHNGTYKQV